jgi:hypothetical protein
LSTISLTVADADLERQPQIAAFPQFWWLVWCAASEATIKARS